MGFQMPILHQVQSNTHHQTPKLQIYPAQQLNANCVSHLCCKQIALLK